MQEKIVELESKVKELEKKIADQTNIITGLEATNKTMTDGNTSAQKFALSVLAAARGGHVGN